MRARGITCFICIFIQWINVHAVFWLRRDRNTSARFELSQAIRILEYLIDIAEDRERFLSYFTAVRVGNGIPRCDNRIYSCSALWLSHARIDLSRLDRGNFIILSVGNFASQRPDATNIPAWKTGTLRFICVAFYRQPTPRNSSKVSGGNHVKIPSETSVSVSEFSLSSGWLICILAFTLLFQSWTFCFLKPPSPRKPPSESHRRCNYGTPVDRPPSAQSSLFQRDALFLAATAGSSAFPSVQQSVWERVFPPQALLHSARVLLRATFYRRVLRDRADPEGDLLLYYSGFFIGPPQSELVRTRKWPPRSSEANPRSSGPDIHRFQSPNILLPRFADTTLRMARFSHSLSAFVASTSFNRPSLSWIKTSASYFEAFTTVPAVQNEFDNRESSWRNCTCTRSYVVLFPYPRSFSLFQQSFCSCLGLPRVQQVSISWFLSSIFLPSIDVPMPPNEQRPWPPTTLIATDAVLPSVSKLLLYRVLEFLR